MPAARRESAAEKRAPIEIAHTTAELGQMPAARREPAWAALAQEFARTAAELGPMPAARREPAAEAWAARARGFAHAAPEERAPIEIARTAPKVRPMPASRKEPTWAALAQEFAHAAAELGPMPAARRESAAEAWAASARGFARTAAGPVPMSARPAAADFVCMAAEVSAPTAFARAAAAHPAPASAESEPARAEAVASGRRACPLYKSPDTWPRPRPGSLRPPRFSRFPPFQASDTAVSPRSRVRRDRSGRRRTPGSSPGRAARRDGRGRSPRRAALSWAVRASVWRAGFTAPVGTRGSPLCRISGLARQFEGRAVADS
ncbi:hypothetical protein ABH920_005267 [Catenulispora sp. EB89]